MTDLITRARKGSHPTPREIELLCEMDRLCEEAVTRTEKLETANQVIHGTARIFQIIDEIIHRNTGHPAEKMYEIDRLVSPFVEPKRKSA